MNVDESKTGAPADQGSAKREMTVEETVKHLREKLDEANQVNKELEDRIRDLGDRNEKLEKKLKGKEKGLKAMQTRIENLVKNLKEGSGTEIRRH